MTSRYLFNLRRWRRFTLALLAVIVSGCQYRGTQWTPPAVAIPAVAILTEPIRTVADSDDLAVSHSSLNVAETLYGQATFHEENCCESCVDLYFQVAALTCRFAFPEDSSVRGHELHTSALKKLIETGQKFDRLDPGSGLRIVSDVGDHWIPLQHHGFAWQASQFSHVVSVGSYESDALRNIHQQDGVGIALVVATERNSVEPFLADTSYFAATFVMDCGPGNVFALDNVQLKLVDPLRVTQTSIQGRRVAIAKDISAPLAYRLKDDQRSYLDNFIHPESMRGESRLYTIEPYQPEKVPVVFIHGLLSDAFTWVEVVNELQACRQFIEHYQIWVYQYPTGRAFLRSSAELRTQLASARATFDPLNDDPQLSNMVLVGHSMGGLIAKLQVSESGDRLWRSIANKPFQQVSLPGQYRQELSNAFFFHPSPHVTRVVCIATPHRGSLYARRLVGRIGSKLVDVSVGERDRHRNVVHANPGVFSDEVSARIPTSIDLLEPQSCLLRAIADLPFADSVTTHTISGVSHWRPWTGESDGVVTVDSTRNWQAVSELHVDEKHTDIHQHTESIDELWKILRQHLDENQAHFTSVSSVSGADSSGL